MVKVNAIDKTIFNTITFAFMIFACVATAYGYIKIKDIIIVYEPDVLLLNSFVFQAVIIAIRVLLFGLFSTSLCKTAQLFSTELDGHKLGFVPAIIIRFIAPTGALLYTLMGPVDLIERILNLIFTVWLFVIAFRSTENIRASMSDKSVIRIKEQKQKAVNYVGTEISSSYDTYSPVQEDKADAFKRGMNKLNELVGLKSLKEEITTFLNMMEVMEARAAKGIEQKKGRMHMAFVGPPGTGKTTVANIMAELLYGMGYIKENKCIVASKDKLVAGYVGQTAIKTKEIVEKAKGGVLFIDEAYSLIPKPQGFEEEAVTTLVDTMGKDNEELVVIFAGYTDEIKKLLDSNEGLKSRVPYIFHFDEYNSDELYEIARRMLDAESFILSNESIEALREQIDIMKPLAHKENGRLISNYIEWVKKLQSNRLKIGYTDVKCLPDGILFGIEPLDLAEAAVKVYEMQI